jgi:hypothetical protein
LELLSFKMRPGAKNPAGLWQVLPIKLSLLSSRVPSSDKRLSPTKFVSDSAAPVFAGFSGTSHASLVPLYHRGRIVQEALELALAPDVRTPFPGWIHIRLRHMGISTRDKRGASDGSDSSDRVDRVIDWRGADVAVFPAVGICAFRWTWNRAFDRADPGALGVLAEQLLIASVV